MEVFPGKGGVLCGIEEVKALLARILPVNDCEVWSMGEGETITAKEVALRIKARYQSYGLYETAIIGILAHCTAWATARQRMR